MYVTRLHRVPHLSVSCPPIIAVRSIVRLLSLRGGGVFPAWTLGVECTCCVDTTLTVPLTVSSHDLPAYQQVWTEYTVPQPSVRFVVLICGGAFRPNDYSSMMRKVMPQLLVIVIDWAVGGHQHDYEIESVNLWVCSLVGSALCLLVIAGPECGPWCVLGSASIGSRRSPVWDLAALSVFVPSRFRRH